MSKKKEYVDIYSYSGGVNSSAAVQIKKEVKSSKVIKSIFCFLFALISVLASISAYVFGTYIGKEKNSLYETPPTQNSVSVTQGDVKPNITSALESVVGICIYNNEQYEYASGVIISNDGYIVTNDHVFASVSGPDIKVSDSKGNYYNAAFIGADKKYDIAVIKIEVVDLTPITAATEISLGEQIYCIGTPMNETLNLSVTQGIISGINRRIGTLTNEYSPRLIQTDAAINPGNSGGAVVNALGQAVGICCSKVTDYDYENIGFAIPIDSALEIADELIGSGVVNGRAMLGISYTAVDYTKSHVLGVTCGIRIEAIDILSDLYGKGFGKGDTITAINGKQIICEDDFLSIIEKSKPNDKIELNIVTVDGMSRETQVVLMEEKPDYSYN